MHVWTGKNGAAEDEQRVHHYADGSAISERERFQHQGDAFNPRPKRTTTWSDARRQKKPNASAISFAKNA